MPLRQSPERLKAQMEEMAAAVERERGAVADAERRLRDLQTRLDTIAKVGSAVAPATGCSLFWCPAAASRDSQFASCCQRAIC